MQNPIPIPITNDLVVAQASPRAGSSAASITLPTTSEMPPITAARRYEVGTMSRPAITAAKVQLTEPAARAIPPANTLCPIAPWT